MDNIYVQILREARRLIESHKQDFVCIAITCSQLGRANAAAALRIRSWIWECTGSTAAVEAWLNKQGIPPELLTDENMRAYRLRWIDHMIEIWKEVE